MRGPILDGENPIFSESLGRGEDVVLVHGWAMHGGFWREFAEDLARYYRVTRLDLPGHGRSAPIDDYTPENIATWLARSAPEKAHWIGWSLGATLVLFLSGLFPERVKSIGLIAGNPKFSKDPDWPHALGNDVLDRFNQNLCEDFTGTLLRFLKIQTLGLKFSQQAYRTLKNRLYECAPPHPRALFAGVEILKFADLREQLNSVGKPVLIVLGTEDFLVPVEVGESLMALNPSAHRCVIQNAGHMPFITHREECLAEVIRFLSKQGTDSDA
ncbi:MAG: pimeloyl-ACP methyl ester esterase BioH [Methylococcaceae bacterium]|nr:pimeloyl-ACP methyl ester esterase BioH [Methylococcaceae bacterium]